MADDLKTFPTDADETQPPAAVVQLLERIGEHLPGIGTTPPTGLQWKELSTAQRINRVDAARGLMKEAMDIAPHQALLHLNLVSIVGRTPIELIHEDDIGEEFAAEVDGAEAAMAHPQLWRSGTADNQDIIDGVLRLARTGYIDLSVRIVGMMSALAARGIVTAPEHGFDTYNPHHPAYVQSVSQELLIKSGTLQRPELVRTAFMLVRDSIGQYPDQLLPYAAQMTLIYNTKPQLPNDHALMRDTLKAMLGLNLESQLWPDKKDVAAQCIYQAMQALHHRSMHREAAALEHKMGPLLDVWWKDTAPAEVTAARATIAENGFLDDDGQIHSVLKRTRSRVNRTKEHEDGKVRTTVERGLRIIDHALEEFPGEIALMVAGIDFTLEECVARDPAIEQARSRYLNGIHTAVANEAPQRAVITDQDATQLRAVLNELRKQDRLNTAKSLWEAAMPHYGPVRHRFASVYDVTDKNGFPLKHRPR